MQLQLGLLAGHVVLPIHTCRNACSTTAGRGWCSHCAGLVGGRVNKIGPDYIGLLVLGVFNAAIGRQNIRSDLQYEAEVCASPAVTQPCMQCLLLSGGGWDVGGSVLA